MKACGNCTLCCNVMAVESLQKPVNRDCQYLAPGNGCKIHGARPDACKSFNCMYLMVEDLPEELRPDKCGVVFFCVPSQPHIVYAHVHPHRVKTLESRLMRLFMKRLALTGAKILVTTASHREVIGMNKKDELVKIAEQPKDSL